MIRKATAKPAEVKKRIVSFQIRTVCYDISEKKISLPDIFSGRSRRPKERLRVLQGIKYGPSRHIAPTDAMMLKQRTTFCIFFGW